LSRQHNLFQNSFSDIITLDNFKRAYDRTQKTDTKYKEESIVFGFDLIENLKSLIEEVKEGSYMPESYNVFKVYEPKERTIAEPSFQDKIVQFAVHNILNPDFENKFIYDSYACINGKGMHKCAERIQHFLAKSSWQWEKPWIIKADIKEFFYSVKHDVLKSILQKEIASRRILSLLSKIIDNSHRDVGLPLGNVTSQLFANIYLNELDKYCKRELSLEFYVRYMDDMVFILPNRERAKSVKGTISDFVQTELDLELNQDKSKIFPMAQGVNMVGYKIWKTHKLLRNKTKQTIKQKSNKFSSMLEIGEITKQKVEQILNSWKGHADYASSENFYQYLEDRFDFIERVNDKFIVSME